MNDDGASDARSALRNVMNGQVERGEPEKKLFPTPPLHERRSREVGEGAGG